MRAVQVEFQDLLRYYKLTSNITLLIIPLEITALGVSDPYP